MRILSISLGISILALLPGARRACAQNDPAGAPRAAWFENSVSYLYGASFRTPFITTSEKPRGADIARSIVEFAHVDSWKYGGNFVNLSLKRSDLTEPAVSGGVGAFEVYAVLRSDFSFNKIGRTRRFTAGPLRDIAFEAGANLNSKNSHYAPAERTLFFGPNFQFKVPRGFLNAGVHLRKEWNYQGIFGKSEEYAPGVNFETTWSVPVPVPRTPLSFAGFATFNGPKGLDSFGHESVAEFLARPRLMLDLGALTFRRRGVLEVGGGVEYWHNMYGKSSAAVPGAKQAAAFFQVTVRVAPER